MRRMSELTGEPMDEPMQEMVARLEGGEDPDALEEEFGDVLDDPDDPMGMGGMDPGDGAGEADGEHPKGRLRRLLARRRRAPDRDDRVFEMADWL
jgi:hypothetical protein